MSDAIGGIEGELWEVVNEFQPNISRSAHEMLRRLIERGVGRMVAEGRIDHINDAIENLRRILRQSISVPVPAGPRVTRVSLEFSLRSLCPIWPFC